MVAAAKFSAVAGQRSIGAQAACHRSGSRAIATMMRPPPSHARVNVRMFGAASTVSQRSPNFSVLTEADLQHFSQILGGDAVVTGPEALRKYNR